MKKRRSLPCLLFLLAVILVMSASIQAAVKPGTVKLSSIKAVDYNKINIKWKKVSGATNYIVYYKKADSGKWIKVKTLDNKKSSYTHTSSTKYPIVVGQKYQYTIKAYNKNTKKSGNYNKKGLTTRTIPATVYGLGAGLTGDNTVNVSWNPAGGTTHYVIYRKANDSAPSKIATISSKYTKYEDKNPVEGVTNTYFVLFLIFILFFMFTLSSFFSLRIIIDNSSNSSYHNYTEPNKAMLPLAIITVKKSEFEFTF